MEMSGVGTVLPVDALLGAASAPVIAPNAGAIQRAFDQIFAELLWEGTVRTAGIGWGSTTERSAWDGLIFATMVSALSESGSLGLGRALYMQLNDLKEI